LITQTERKTIIYPNTKYHQQHTVVIDPTTYCRYRFNYTTTPIAQLKYIPHQPNYHHWSLSILHHYCPLVLFHTNTIAICPSVYSNTPHCRYRTVPINTNTKHNHLYLPIYSLMVTYGSITFLTIPTPLPTIFMHLHTIIHHSKSITPKYKALSHPQVLTAFTRLKPDACKCREYCSTLHLIWSLSIPTLVFNNHQCYSNSTISTLNSPYCLLSNPPN
jgi:hypothetical protein